MIDLTKPLQLSDGTRVNYNHISQGLDEIVVNVAEGWNCLADNYRYLEGGKMAFHAKTLKHVCSDLTLQNVKTFDPTKPVQTRDGRKARILATDMNSSAPIAVILQNRGGFEFPTSRYPDGRYVRNVDSDNDIINVPETRTYGDTLAATGTGVNVTTVDGVVTKVELMS